ncbi:MAG TPA: hypothetical protein VL096_14000, partial [Pirellulaceae bacterium]|nr:hypothetical protein [Pirellulaceae bacterium]
MVALAGTAHLAWGLAIFAAMLFAAQQSPVESTWLLHKLGLATYLTGLLYLALLGWVEVDRGWKLRRPGTESISLGMAEFVGNLLIAGATLPALWRGSSSRSLATGLDRLLVAALLASAISAGLLLIVRALTRRRHKPTQSHEDADRKLGYSLLLSQIVFLA